MLLRASKFLLGTFIWMLLASACTFCAPQPAYALSASGSVGVDYWRVPDAPVRYMPNYSLPDGHEWNSVSKWARGTVQHQIETPLNPIVVTAQGRYSTLTGGRIDRLDVAMHVTDSTGVRVGVLPYKVSWCRTYDANSPWMAEPDAFCRFLGLNELAQGAFGVQAYHSDIAAGWLLDSMVGVYRPSVDGQDKELGPYVRVGPNTMHKKVGASFNALHLSSGIQVRAAFLNTLQNQKSDAGSYERQLDYDTRYLAIEGNPLQNVTLRLSSASYVGKQNNPALPYGWDGQSKTLEAIYKPVAGHSIALGASEYTNVTTYSVAPNGQRLNVPSLSMAWRKDWPDGVHTVLQATRSLDDSVTRRGVVAERAGNAVGVRLGKSF